MDIAFWASRWNENRIGFHEGKANQFLVRHAETLGEGRNVLVPLCGKAEDLAYLAARGHKVIGIEAVEDAVKAFFQEHDLTPTVREGRGGRIYEAASVTIVAGDMFAVTTEDVGPVDALYDRAALIALTPETRPRYAARVAELLTPGARGILVTVEYPEDKMEPPPHSVREPEVRALYKNVTVLEHGRSTNDRIPDGIELCYALSF